MFLKRAIDEIKKGNINIAYPLLVAQRLSRSGLIGKFDDNDALDSALKTYADAYLNSVNNNNITIESAKQTDKILDIESLIYDNRFYTGPDPKLTSVEFDRLSKLHNKYKNQRIFVMGNGPSLNNLDLELLKDEHVFCLNRISLLLEKVSWTPDFYAAFDLTVVPDNLDEFNDLKIPHKFFATKHKGAILEKDEHYWYHDNSRPGDLQDRFNASSAITGFGGGGTVTVLAIQLAFFMGFDPIILIGCDASYSVPKTVIQSGPDKFKDGVKLYLTSTEDKDENHFDPRYFGKGKRWHNPNVVEMHVGFEKCFRAITKKNRTIVNATSGGALECIPRCNFSNLFIAQSSKKRIKVGVDLSQSIANLATGMMNYLLGALKNIDLYNVDLDLYLFCTKNNYEMINKCKPRCAKIILDDDNKFKNYIDSLDCIHYPFNSIVSAISVGENTKKIVSIHDLIPINQPGFPDSIKNTYIDAAKNADAIICLSDPIREQVCTKFEFSREACFVSPPVVNDDLSVIEVEPEFDVSTVDEAIAAVKKKNKLRFPYILYPAAYRPHKNHMTLINAMRYVYSNLHLVLTTGESHDPSKANSLTNEINKLNLSHRIHVLGHLEREEFINLYKGAVAVVFPSLDEGFGIPVSEAQSLCIPVLSSRCGSLSDVAKGSIEIDPKNIYDMAEKINNIHSDEELRKKCIEDGLVNVRRFTKESGAKGLLEAYYHVCL